jgi:hypothetical protein
MSNDIRAINSSLNLMNIVCKDKKFKSIDSLKFEIERLEVNLFLFSFKIKTILLYFFFKAKGHKLEGIC